MTRHVILPVPATAKNIHKGVRVKPSGVGRTSRWPRLAGTVERRAGLRVFVRWDGTTFSDEMAIDEVVLA